MDTSQIIGFDEVFSATGLPDTKESREAFFQGLSYSFHQEHFPDDRPPRPTLGTESAFDWKEAARLISGQHSDAMKEVFVDGKTKHLNEFALRVFLAFLGNDPGAVFSCRARLSSAIGDSVASAILIWDRVELVLSEQKNSH
jgi:hypothetical protein